MKRLFIIPFILCFTALTQAQSPVSCNDFELSPNTQYVISAWVSVDTPTAVDSYSDVFVLVRFPPSGAGDFIVQPVGPIIDGWQQITGIVPTPESLNSIQIQPTNDSAFNAYFDDIRIHPLNGNLKSFVYDSSTQRLMAELDENNFATYYEYDQEGGLIRVKKETERGVYTIQETRSGNSTYKPID